MRKPSPFLLAIISSLIVVVIGLSHALLRYSPYAPAVNSEQKFDGGLQTHQGDDAKAKGPESTAPGVPGVGGEGGGRRKTKAEHGEEEGTEFLPAFYGLRLKITDTLVASFTALLFFATLALWLATRKLVSGADDAAWRQLRAYLSMKPGVFSNFGAASIVQVEFFQKNHGQTPAFRITHIFGMGVFPNPLPAGFIFPKPSRKVDTSHTLFPGDDAKAWFNHERLLTNSEVAIVAADTSRFHIWGVTSYRDAFLRKRETIFSANVGGSNFASSQQLFQAGNPNGPPWNWEYGSDHNYAT